MRIDVVTIFPEFFSVLDVSLLGKARQAELVQTHVHDLREWAAVKADGTPDVHRTVDDAPFGGGAGMVMKADVWGRALDDVLEPGGVLVVPSPAGVPFTQALAADLAQAEQLAFACGRYEGIDARVAAALRGGGLPRAGALARRLRAQRGRGGRVRDDRGHHPAHPGLHGQRREHRRGKPRRRPPRVPVVHAPASWRGLDVPDVLLSGHHGKIEAWRREQQLQRTRERRPDLFTDARRRCGTIVRWCERS